jgi:hypothetical protein
MHIYEREGHKDECMWKTGYSRHSDVLLVESRESLVALIHCT